MEFKLGSVWLLLSYSLQQSLLGILAIVPQTNANKNCIGSNGEPVKRVQMIRRIPARCSGWEEAWSWASKTDCSTKYVYEYVDMPSGLTGDVDEDCENEAAASSEKDQFSVTEEKFLAIAFGSATVALLVLIVIIVISLLRRGQNRCYSLCGGGSGYTSANRSERDSAGQPGHACNEYVDEGGHRMSENVYEEIRDGSHGTKAKFPGGGGVGGDTERKGFHNGAGDYPVKEKSGQMPPTNGVGVGVGVGVSNGAVIPSAPLLEEELHQTTCASANNPPPVPTMDQHQCSMMESSFSNTSDSVTPKELAFAAEESAKECYKNKDDDKVKSDDDKDKDKKCDDSKKNENVYSKFNDLVARKSDDSEPVHPEAPLLPLSDITGEQPVVLVSSSSTSHSYENLQPELQCELNENGYDSLIKSQSDSGLSLTCANDVDGLKFESCPDEYGPKQPEVLPLEDLQHTDVSSVTCQDSNQYVVLTENVQ